MGGGFQQRAWLNCRPFHLAPHPCTSTPIPCKTLGTVHSGTWCQEGSFSIRDCGARFQAETGVFLHRDSDVTGVRCGGSNVVMELMVFS